MSTLTAERLYGLLPAVYRLRDAEQGEPLRALIAAFAQEFAALEENVDQLYDDQFIETCADWVGALYRRPDRLSAAARRGAQGRLAARRGRQHHRLPPPQGHGADAGAAGRRTSPTGRRTPWSSSSCSPRRST